MNSNENGMTDDEIMTRAGKLPREVMPSRNLWPGIEAAIAAEAPDRGRRWSGMFAQAAAVLLLVGGSSGLTWLAMQDDATLPVADDSGAALTFEPVSGSFGSQYNLGPDFQDARSSLVSKLDEELARLSPDTRSEVERNMATIRAAIVEINQALAKEPDNALLQELLISSYREELAIMRKVDVIANAVMHRTDI